MKTNLSRLCWSLFAAALVGGAGIAGAADAPSAKQLHRVNLTRPLRSTYTARSADRTPVNVVAILSGDSVAMAQANAGRRLSRAEKNALKAQRAADQAAVIPAIQAAGARVQKGYQSALNGVRVSIPRNQISALRRVPGVVDVLPVAVHKLNNIVSVPRIQAPIAWSGAAGFRGEGVKIAVIDTGIDYTHANFGGPGTVAAYQAALASDTLPPDPSLVGPNAPKVKGGTDLVGDDYDADPTSATYQPVPHPDPNPLDCNSHGSHVAGTAAGFGVLTTGATYKGPYNELTDINNNFTIGPGVAPKADVYSVRVFGCQGSTDVVTDAIEWAVDNDMDVISMSLGSDFGPGDTDDAKAADDAVRAGVVVVSAAGNGGDILYISGDPGSSLKGISVAASARAAQERTVDIALPAVTGSAATSIHGINANNGKWTSPLTLPIVVLRKTDGTVSLGCDPQEYVNAAVAGKIAVVQRGTCARVARAIFGQEAGAAAVIMINNAATLPPFEDDIIDDPDTGQLFTVTIPFFGVAGPATGTTDGTALALRDGQAITLTEGTPIETGMATFSSTGPRAPDSRLKPDITAPGMNIISTGMGTGNQALVDSGTSMATPHISGVAALGIQAHPRWKPNQIKSAIINSGDPAPLVDYEARRSGSGFVNAAAVAGTQAIAYADADETTANFQLTEMTSDFSDTKTITVRNDGATPVSFSVAVDHKSGSSHSASLSTSHITVGPRSQGTVDLTLKVPVATAGSSAAFTDVAGLVTFSPVAGSNHGYSLRVPYYLVPRVESNVDAKLALKAKATQGVVALTNQGSPIPATADFYAWGLLDQNDGLGRVDLYAAGAQSFVSNGDAQLVFAVASLRGSASVEEEEIDVLVDVDGDGQADYDIFSADLGVLTTGLANGEVVAVIANLKTGALSADFDVYSPNNNSVVLLPVLASSIGVTAASPRISYTVQSFDRFSDDTDSFDQSASFNVFSSAVSTGQFATVNPNAAIGVTVSVNPAEFAITPPLGFMIVTQDNKSGRQEVNLISVKR
jgi:minor extracellular serine protease Vpr